MVKKFLTYLLENEKEFVSNFKQHCLYLFEVAYGYYKKTEQPVGEVSPASVRSGLAIPLAYVMSDLKFDMFKIDFASTQKTKYDYLPNLFKKDVIKALASIVDYTIAAEEYIKTGVKEDLVIDDLSTLSKENIIDALKNKKRIVAKKTESSLELFPLEIVKSE